MSEELKVWNSVSPVSVTEGEKLMFFGETNDHIVRDGKAGDRLLRSQPVVWVQRPVRGPLINSQVDN